MKKLMSLLLIVCTLFSSSTQMTLAAGTAYNNYPTAWVKDESAGSTVSVEEYVTLGTNYNTVDVNDKATNIIAASFKLPYTNGQELTANEEGFATIEWDKGNSSIVELTIRNLLTGIIIFKSMLVESSYKIDFGSLGGNFRASIASVDSEGTRHFAPERNTIEFVVKPTMIPASFTTETNTKLNANSNGKVTLSWQSYNCFYHYLTVRDLTTGKIIFTSDLIEDSYDIAVIKGHEYRASIASFDKNGNRYFNSSNNTIGFSVPNDEVTNQNFSPLWPTDGGSITAADIYPSSGKAHSCRYAHGIDIGVKSGTNVYATESGVVDTVKNLGDSSFGKYIVIKHSNGAYSLYAHLSQQLVQEGDHVSRGQIIAKSGNTGNSTGPHLHFEISTSTKNRLADYFPNR